jgi:hypothetical protein
MQRAATEQTFAELVTLMQFEPFIQQCVRVIESACLSRDLECSTLFKTTTSRFQQHLEVYYKPFCRDAIRLFFFCGFVPWRLRTLDSGDKVPEALPIGSFRWSVRPCTKAEAARGEPLLVYELSTCSLAVALKV